MPSRETEVGLAHPSALRIAELEIADVHPGRQVVQIPKTDRSVERADPPDAGHPDAVEPSRLTRADLRVRGRGHAKAGESQGRPPDETTGAASHTDLRLKSGSYSLGGYGAH